MSRKIKDLYLEEYIPQFATEDYVDSVSSNINNKITSINGEILNISNIVEDVSSDYLKATVFNSISVDVGLNRANANDKVIISSDINSLNLPSYKIGNGHEINGTGTVAFGNTNTVYTDNSIAEGEFTQAGTRSFRIVSGDISASTWTLKTTEGIQPGYAYTVRLLNNYDMAGIVVSVLNDKTISVDGFPTPRRAYSEYLSDPYLSGQSWYSALSASGIRAHPSPKEANEYVTHTGSTYPPEYCFYDFDFDANSMWFLGHPEIGDISAYATGAHAEGYMTQAGRQYSHAEGLSSMTVGKYAHAEGWQTIAAWAAHSEGYMTSAFGQRSHAEGSGTLTRGTASLACGVRTTTLGEGSFACGGDSTAIGDGSFACGKKSIAVGKHSFAYNGMSNTEYAVGGDGQFGINPIGGEWGFYIGDRSLGKVISDIEPNTSRLETALSAPGYEYETIQFSIVSGMHINTNPSNLAPIGTPIPADEESYTGEYCLLAVKAGDEYEISTRLGDRMCIMLHSNPFIPLSTYEEYVITSNYAYKKFDVAIPDGCHFMTVDNYTKKTSVYKPISIKKKGMKYCQVYEISQKVDILDERILALEQGYADANRLADEIINN